MQGLELLVTVLLAQNRQPPPTVAAGVPHAEFAAELLTLPSGLLAMVCEAIVKLESRYNGVPAEVPSWLLGPAEVLLGPAGLRTKRFGNSLREFRKRRAVRILAARESAAAERARARLPR